MDPTRAPAAALVVRVGAIEIEARARFDAEEVVVALNPSRCPFLTAA